MGQLRACVQPSRVPLSGTPSRSLSQKPFLCSTFLKQSRSLKNCPSDGNLFLLSGHLNKCDQMKFIQWITPWLTQYVYTFIPYSEGDFQSTFGAEGAKSCEHNWIIFPAATKRCIAETLSNPEVVRLVNVLLIHGSAGNMLLLRLPLPVCTEIPFSSTSLTLNAHTASIYLSFRLVPWLRPLNIPKEKRKMFCERRYRPTYRGSSCMKSARCLIGPRFSGGT